MEEEDGVPIIRHSIRFGKSSTTMQLRKSTGPMLLAALLFAAIYGVILTRPGPPATKRAPGARGQQGGPLVVDESALETIKALLRMPTSPEERETAQLALRLADKASDLAFAQAVWRMASRPAAATPEAQQINARLQEALKTLATDKATVDRLTAAVARASVTDAPRLKDQLELAKAIATLDQDAVDDAQEDLMSVGGNPQSGFDEMIRQHEAVSQSSDTLRIATTPLVIKPGLVSHVVMWQSLRDKRHALQRAESSADSTATVLRQRHDSIQARAARRLQASPESALSSDSTAALLAEARRQTLRQKSRATLDRRVDNQEQLAGVLATWTTIVHAQERAAINRALHSVVTLLLIVLIGVLLLRWTERTASRLAVDRRRMHTLRMVGRVALQVVTILLVLLVMFGPPSNLGTFLGLAGAGLTVALKDFIVGFIRMVRASGAGRHSARRSRRDQRRNRRGDRGRNLSDRVARDRRLGCVEPSYRPSRDVQQQLRHRRSLLQFFHYRPVAVGRTPDRGAGGTRSVSDQRVSSARGRGSNHGERAAGRDRVEGSAPHAAVRDADGDTDGELEADPWRRGDRSTLRDTTLRALGDSGAAVSRGDGPVGLGCSRERGMDERRTR